MYIRFELTDTDMEFKIKDEAGSTLEEFDFPIIDYRMVPFYKMKDSNLIIIVGINDPDDAFPPVYSCPRDKTIFINSLTESLQENNEIGPV